MKVKGMEPIIDSTDKRQGYCTDTEWECIKECKTMEVTPDTTPKSTAQRIEHIYEVRVKGKALAEKGKGLVQKWAIHMVRNCVVLSPLNQMIQVCILCAALHCNPDIYPVNLCERFSIDSAFVNVLYSLRRALRSCTPLYILTRCLCNVPVFCLLSRW